MSDFFKQFVEQLIATSIAEWVAVILAVVYLLLAIKEHIGCWLAAFFSTAIYSVLFFDVNLYMESVLNIYYLVMAIYGYYQWRYKTQGEIIKPIIKWPVSWHLKLIIGILILVIASGWLLENYTDQDFAYLDSLTTWFAIATTYMVAKKVLENWIYWIVIDSVSIFIYLQKGFALTAVLFVSYLLLAFIGWLKWKQRYEKQIESTSLVAT
ncbi:nicotinamide riboside transporter PnuC [Aliikangiella maris]|uniref:Nicotinamide riboside transporter PnuC n=2 Tax=Aliikangiella maris TaxID=3162458 RepID=A0ABV2BTX0_9GAMM